MTENTTTTIIIIASNWFLSPPSPPDQYPLISIGGWPWTNLRIDQYRYLYYRARFPESPILYWSRITAYPSLLVCLIGSIFTVLTALSAKTREKASSSFYVVLITIACFDAAFMIMISIRNAFYLWPVSSTSFRWAAIVLSGPSYACSLMSDALTLCLSVERCLAIKFPIFYKNFQTQPTKKRFAWMGALIFSVGLSLTRVHYSLEKLYPELFDISWFIWISYFSDVIVPIIMTVVMIPIVGVIVFGLKKRRNTVRNLTTKNSTTAGQNQDQSMKMISLLISLLIMYFLNQLGYTLYCVSDFNYEPQLASINYASSYDQVKSFADAHFFVIAAQAYSIVAEYISRSVVFYCYVSFNRKFRNDFINLMKNCVNRVGQTKSGTVSSPAGCATLLVQIRETDKP